MTRPDYNYSTLPRQFSAGQLCGKHHGSELAINYHFSKIFIDIYLVVSWTRRNSSHSASHVISFDCSTFLDGKFWLTFVRSCRGTSNSIEFSSRHEPLIERKQKRIVRKPSDLKYDNTFHCTIIEREGEYAECHTSLVASLTKTKTSFKFPFFTLCRNCPDSSYGQALIIRLKTGWC